MSDDKKLIPLDHPSVRGVLVDDGEPRVLTGNEHYIAADGTVRRWNVRLPPSTEPHQPVKLRPASEFGVAARGESGLKKLPEGELYVLMLDYPRCGELYFDAHGIQKAISDWSSADSSKMNVFRKLDPALHGIPDGGERDEAFIAQCTVVNDLTDERDKLRKRIKELEAEVENLQEQLESADSAYRDEKSSGEGHRRHAERQGIRIKELEAELADLKEINHTGSEVLAELSADHSRLESDAERLRKAIREAIQQCHLATIDRRDVVATLQSALSPSSAAASGDKDVPILDPNQKLRTTSFKRQADGTLKRTVRSETLTEFADRVVPTSAPAAESDEDAVT